MSDLTVFLNENYQPGWVDDEGQVTVPLPVLYGEAQLPGHATLVCRRCGEPSWAVTRHAVEKHGHDIEVRPPLPGKTRPEFFREGWI